ncbi:MAG: hypothetical protein P8X42_19305, partial [Calditrichaceae bacterium]
MDTIFIDAGVEHIRIKSGSESSQDGNNNKYKHITLNNNNDIRVLFEENNVFSELINNNNGSTSKPDVFITGKLAEITRNALESGETISTEAALWSAAKTLFRADSSSIPETLGIIDLSASGYMVICIEKDGQLKDDILITNPRCGAGTGINLSRILEKLDISRDLVDGILADYLGEKGAQKRAEIPVRADRCGVFSSSATVSDKNQGIPLDYALAVTMKSEVMKPCQKMPENISCVHLTGGVFRWQYARDCARDILQSKGIQNIVYDDEQSVLLSGMEYLVRKVGHKNFR